MPIPVNPDVRLSNPRVVINLDELRPLQRVQLANILSHAAGELGVAGSESDRAFTGVADFIKDNNGASFLAFNVRRPRL